MTHVSISVLMSIYSETERQIRESIDSILNQTQNNFEFIIVCDNPTRKDEVKHILETYSDKRIKLLQNDKNIGLALSMNKAASVSTAPVIARMDADDIALDTRFEKEYHILEENKVDIVFTDFSYIDERSCRIKGKKHLFAVEIEGDVPSHVIALKPNLVHHPTVMMKKDIFDRVGGYRDFPCSQDVDLWYRMQEAGAKFYLLREILLLYRITPKSITNSKFYLQQLTVHYINTLSLERLMSGSDSFSKENYKFFLQKHGYGVKSKEKRYKIGAKFLDKAQVLKFPFNFIYRVFTFLISPQLRYNYLILKKKRSLYAS